MAVRSNRTSDGLRPCVCHRAASRRYRDWRQLGHRRDGRGLRSLAGGRHTDDRAGSGRLRGRDLFELLHAIPEVAWKPVAPPAVIDGDGLLLLHAASTLKDVEIRTPSDTEQACIGDAILSL